MQNSGIIKYGRVQIIRIESKFTILSIKSELCIFWTLIKQYYLQLDDAIKGKTRKCSKEKLVDKTHFRLNKNLFVTLAG